MTILNLKYLFLYTTITQGSCDGIRWIPWRLERGGRAGELKSTNYKFSNVWADSAGATEEDVPGSC